MTKLFPVIQIQQQSDNVTELQLEISPDIAYFDGHFPQAPVLAGVTQLHWVMHYCKQYFPQLADVISVEVLKFQVMIRPHDILTLRLELTGSNVVQFGYFKQDAKVASGRLKWALKTDA